MGNYTLIITEKPDAAGRIAYALDEAGNPRRTFVNGVPCYEAQRQQKKLMVVPATGHLYTIAASAESRGQLPVFSYRWLPRNKAERGAARIGVWLRTITQLSQDADEFVDACDYDLEGSIIGFCILRYACGSKDGEAKRMKYSTLTDEELRKAFASLLPHLDFNLVEAGLARHEVDWLYGINLSRALTSAAKNSSGQYITLSTGRVQGPTLKFLAARERNIARFVPKPFWVVIAKAKIGDAVFNVQHEKAVFESVEEAKRVVTACKGKTGTAESVETNRFNQMPPPAFDLGTLQSEAYRVFGYTPMRTSSTTQRLYLDALISYPRTSSQKLPPAIGYEKILKGLVRNREFTKQAAELLGNPQLCPVQGKKSDPAHPAIYPTGKIPSARLSGAERNIYSLVARRFMATFGASAVQQLVKITLNVNSEKLFLNGKQTLEQGWLRFYEPFARLQEMILPPVEKGESVFMERVTLKEEFTTPPSRYNPASLLRKMEQCNIGTKATRAGIMQTLYDRKYIRDEKIVVTELGLEVTDVLRRYCPSVVLVEFTRQLEQEMAQIQEGKKNKEKVVSDAVEALKPVLANLKAYEKAVGEQLSRAVQQAKLEERVIGPCPVCRSGKLTIQHSKKSGKRFVGCTNYFSGVCKTAFPLPQKGNVKPSGRACRRCGWSTVAVWLWSRRQWELCLNPQCPTKKKRKAAAQNADG